MTSRTCVCWLILAEAACLALGLAFYCFYVSSSIRQAAAEAVRSDLAAEVERLGAAARTWKFDQLSRTQDDFDAALHPDPGSAPPGELSFVLIDENRQIVRERPASSIAHATEAEAEVSNWLAGAVPVEPPTAGLVQSRDGRHLAAILPIAGGTLVVHRDTQQVKLATAIIVPMLRTAGGLSWLWTCGLLSMAVILIVGHFNGPTSDRGNSPEVEALKQAQTLVRTQETVIFGLAKLSDSRDPETGDHLERISYYSSTLASALRQHPDFQDVVTPTFIRLIGISSALHDIGKVGVQDAILRKAGALTADERSRMEQHTLVGEECLKEIERRLGTSNFLHMAREIAYSHHERWDGDGYPQGLAGEHIPLAARVVAIADVYDALASKRVYKDALPHEQCVAIIASEAGKHFDPRLVEVFLQIEESFGHMACQFRSEAAADQSLQLFSGEADEPTLAEAAG